MSKQKHDPSTAASQGAAIPRELLLRRDRSIRYERGGKVYATDGLVGSLTQLVVDQAAGAVTALVVAPTGTSQKILVPPELVDKTAGSAVFLALSRAQFQARAPQAPAYDKRQYVKASAKALLGKGTTTSFAAPRRAVLRAGRDFVETPPVTLGDRPPPSAAGDPDPRQSGTRGRTAALSRS